MGNLGGGEILVILLVALIFLGPEELPRVVRQLAKLRADIRKVTDRFQSEVQDLIRIADESMKAVVDTPPTAPIDDHVTPTVTAVAEADAVPPVHDAPNIARPPDLADPASS